MALDNPISTTEAAIILGISASRVRQVILGGRLEATKVGREQLLERESRGVCTDTKRTH